MKAGTHQVPAFTVPVGADAEPATFDLNQRVKAQESAKVKFPK
ncbi:hypothetical protein [Paenarthrobacter aurescens]|nr:hypothetical protein [Paenarthrobacter aurescens]